MSLRSWLVRAPVISSDRPSLRMIKERSFARLTQSRKVRPTMISTGEELRVTTRDNVEASTPFALSGGAWPGANSTESTSSPSSSSRSCRICSSAIAGSSSTTVTEISVTLRTISHARRTAQVLG